MSVDITTIFYPTTPSKVVDPDEGAALFAEQYSQSPGIGIITEFTDLILESALAKPEHLDSLIQTALLISCNESLPTVYWTMDRPNSTFDEVFHVDFRDKIHSNLSVIHPNPFIIHSNLSISETSEHVEFLNCSFIAGRARSLGLMSSPETAGAVAEGLKFPDEVLYHSTGEIAEIETLGACLQLLGSASKLIELFGERFAIEKVVKSLQGIRVSAPDKPLVDLTIRHLQSTPLKDITSSEIVQNTRSAGWNRFWANTVS